jgi:hypothetical protein
VLKLYKRGRSGVRYWEAWGDGPVVIIHTGKLGQTGTVRKLTREKGQTTTKAIAAAAAAPLARGYAEIPLDEHRQIVVQYRCAGWGSVEDLDKRHQVEELFNECLGWTGNGHCDGGDIGSGSMNVYSYAVDAQLAVKTILATLRKHRLLKGAVVAVEEGDDYRVVYPANFQGEFSID